MVLRVPPWTGDGAQVPVIAWSVLVFATYSGLVLPLDLQPLAGGLLALPGLEGSSGAFLEANLAFCITLLYAVYYTWLDVGGGLSWALCVGAPVFVLACLFRESFGAGAWRPALGAHVLGWYMQLHPGHKIFEKRKPALLDGLVQSFATAPLFVWFEVVFFFGLRAPLKEEMKRRVSILLSIEAKKKR